ncbi:MAG: hypothetical protein ABI967_15335 [bacterium]
MISLVLLAVALFARYLRRPVGPWCWIYVIATMVGLYLNVFVLIVQSFQKVPSLKALAPTQTEPAFVAAQLFTLMLFAVLTITAAFRFRVASVSGLG